MLAGQQVHPDRPHKRPVGGGGLRFGREGRLGGAPAAAAAGLGQVLGHLQAPLGQVEHLAALGGDHLGVGQTPAAPAAAIWPVVLDAVGIGDLGKVGSRPPGLLARSSFGLFLHELLGLGPGPPAALGAAEAFLLLFGSERCASVSDEGGLPEFPECFDCSRRNRSTSASSDSNAAFSAAISSSRAASCRSSSAIRSATQWWMPTLRAIGGE